MRGRPIKRGCSIASSTTLRGHKEKLGIEVADAFGDNFFDTFTVTPPMRGIVVRTRHGDDTDPGLFAKRFLIKEARPASVKALSQNIESADRHIMITKPVSQR